jgi:hypothetical protein
VAGSYLFAELSGWLKRTVETWGDRGKLMLPELLHIPRAIFIPLFLLVLVAGLFALARFTPR